MPEKSNLLNPKIAIGISFLLTLLISASGVISILSIATGVPLSGVSDTLTIDSTPIYADANIKIQENASKPVVVLESIERGEYVHIVNKTTSKKLSQSGDTATISRGTTYTVYVIGDSNQRKIGAIEVKNNG